MTERVSATGAVEETPPAGALAGVNIGRRVFSNAVAQLVGRFAVAATRFIMVAAIVRTGGRSLFAEYSIVLGVLSLGEWLVDFGTTDAFTREVCREPQHTRRTLRTLAALKLVQFPVALAVLLAILLLFRYPRNVIQAGMVGALSLIWFSGVLIYRVVFRSRMRVEWDVLAEFCSVLVLVPLTLLVCHYHLGLVAIFWAYFASRMVYFLCSMRLGASGFQLSVSDVRAADVSWGARTSFAIGVAGFLAVGYETTDILLLSRFGSVSDVAMYSAAQKLAAPVMMAVAAVASTFYPVFASFWPKDKARFESTAQRGFDLVLLLAGLAVTPLLAGADFFMRLLAKQLGEGAPALQGIAVLCFVKTVTITLGPVLYIVFAQRALLKMVAVALVAKALLISVLARRFGYVAVIGTSLALEFVFAFVTVVMIRRFTGWRVRWRRPIYTVSTLLLAVLLPYAAHLRGLSAACVGIALYSAISLSAGAIKIADIKRLMGQKQKVLVGA